jgi:histidyl-tRNA synthetase
MSKKINLSIPKGTRDFLPEEMIMRQEVLDRIRSVFELFGFAPLETPAIENFEILSAKDAGGDEILNETYNFKDKADRMIGLRYDLTVPLARVVAMNPGLTIPFKRYQIQNVWRYGDVAKARLREFLQADVDIVGSDSMLADAEIITCACYALESIGLEKFTVRINNRKILSGVVKYCGIDENQITDVLRSIDKLDKIGTDGVEKELVEKGFSEKTVEKLLGFVKIQGDPEKVLQNIEVFVKSSEELRKGIEETKILVDYLKKMGVKKFKIDLSLARGLDYYTGPIFEIFAEEGIGSISAGGRYDKLVGLFSGKETPATGISLGIERVIEVMKVKKIFENKKSRTKVFVVCVKDEVQEEVLKIVRNLRKSGIPSGFDLRGRNLTRQLEYADSIGIPYAMIVGPNEIKENKVKIRDMKKREETEVELKDLASFFKKSDL